MASIVMPVPTPLRRLIHWLAVLPALGLWLGGCGTGPKPSALVSYEELRQKPEVDGARKRFPDLVASSEQFGERATKDWQSNDMEESNREALMAEIKLKTALARYDQEQAKSRLKTLSGDQAKADETLASVNKDLAAINEQIALMEKLADARKSADSEKQRLAAQMTEEQQKTAQLSRQLETEQKLATAQLALRTADTVDAQKYAAAEYTTATAMLTKAESEMKQNNWAAAQASIEVAQQNAERASQIAKPRYEQAEQTNQDKARNEALARDAASLTGVSVRLERRGELQRLVIAVQDLFTRNQTTLMPGRDAPLGPIAELIRKYSSYPVQVVAHTDNRGRTGELLAMSQARAQTVFSALVSRGVEARRMMVSGQGPNEPIADNRSAAGRAKNSRVEIIFLYH